MIDRPALEAALGAAEAPELLALAGELQGRAWARLTPAPAVTSPPPGRLITPGEAAAIANIPTKRLYEWARKKSWAHRPNQRTLRINETGFRRWLESR